MPVIRPAPREAALATASLRLRVSARNPVFVRAETQRRGEGRRRSRSHCQVATPPGRGGKVRGTSHLTISRGNRGSVQVEFDRRDDADLLEGRIAGTAAAFLAGRVAVARADRE